MSSLRPRLCVLEKGTGGYGFHLHGEKGKTGQFIRLVEPDTPASASGLLAGDRLAFVNGESVEGESHQQVVARIRATTGALELIVVDDETAELLKKHNLQCRKEFVTEGIPLPGGDSDSDRGDTQSNGTPRESTPVPRENGDTSSEKSDRLSTKDESDGLRPRLCHMEKGANGYGFNLHSEKSKPGQYIRAVDGDSPAHRAGLRPQDKIIQVNGTSVIGMQHSEVVAAIKAGGDQTRLLVVDAKTEEFFMRCNVLPTEEHVTGPLPEPVSERASEEEEASAQMKPKVSVSSSASSASSNASLPAATTSSPPAEVEKAPEPAPGADTLGLSMSLAQAKERAHQKRAAKKAPPMDWSKRNELFSNL
ncbi:Na(+)/H(+) exchange regulatory cofactor NHE-RF1a [Toxotes jaculatrix]|uniref:Na(+)/H(+) exchange regulatory cofactor NHE-RF1a n=1 Tax=Toxotes jaculatrix TaxID=941984 RepID=UPI001B3B028F|nr:Na(+)/H(+) exchange regulatory cofactor NHE-RF1a [Toxotes jaculatrix]XP_040922606.1 Na(+)/H(+) exchange regulatory cofactor NHE-RF1a [Toxotes jaculatrix]